jgi:DnaJ-class molecular chaperone
VIGDSTKKYMSILEIKEYPFTYETLKTNYRKLLLKNHPDHNKNGKEKTIKIIKAYNIIKNLSINIDINGQRKIIEKAEKDMFDFTELCVNCNGKGYNLKATYNAHCPVCNNHYFFVSFTQGQCRSCHGTGKFKQVRSKRIVICRDCKGTGKCFKCNGEGFIDPKSIKENCFRCNGTGKIKLNPFNPVIPKGAIL